MKRLNGPRNCANCSKGPLTKYLHYIIYIYGGILNGFFKPFPISRINSQGAIDLMHLLFFANIISLNVSSADVRADKKYE